MRLLSAEVKGYGRLVDAKVNLDSKVIAVVGPNEAGKTTLLTALAHIESSDAVSVAERSRAATIPDTAAIVTARFSLNDADRGVVVDLSLEEAPKTMSASRAAGGGTIRIGVVPRPRKATQSIRHALAVLRTTLTGEDVMKLVNRETVYGDPHSDAARDFETELIVLADGIELLLSGDESAPTEQDLAAKVVDLRGGAADGEDTRDLRDAFDEIESWCLRADPAPEVRQRLWSRTPDFLLFDEQNRTLQSVYTLDEALVSNPPAALSNLARMAGLDLTTLFQHMQSGDIARRETVLARANTELEKIFAESWRQSNLTVRLIVDGQDLRVVIWDDGDNVTVFSERSAGLRTFIALMAFLRARGHSRPPILLIDEAESHLHIDAQADLVNMFMTQTQAVKVIYTTHSPACLPPDLGTGIRAIVPRADNLQISDIRNSFWHSGAGYSPLMLAMGAAAAAFTPARRVVLSEGATEMILMPTLIRSATGEDSLSYQIAPGLSEVPKDVYPRLDLEGAKVAYLLDDDQSGKERAKGLMKAGVPEDLIVSIGVDGVENLLEPDAYREAIKSLVLERPDLDSMPDLPELPEASGESWANVIAAWFATNSIDPPSKVAISNWLVENGKAEPSVEGRTFLLRVHAELLRALDRLPPKDTEDA